MADPNERDAKPIQYLTEAYGKERELETALQAHIAMTTRPPYKKRLKLHLRETKGHAKGLERQIKKLGGGTGWAGEIKTLTGAVVAEEVPRGRRNGSRSRERSRKRSAAAGRSK
jgi:ferritin-like metal-binding protein YciE